MVRGHVLTETTVTVRVTVTHAQSTTVHLSCGTLSGLYTQECVEYHQYPSVIPSSTIEVLEIISQARFLSLLASSRSTIVELANLVITLRGSTSFVEQRLDVLACLPYIGPGSESTNAKKELATPTWLVHLVLFLVVGVLCGGGTVVGKVGEIYNTS